MSLYDTAAEVPPVLLPFTTMHDYVIPSLSPAGGERP
jgi:hypothetical protein